MALNKSDEHILGSSSSGASSPATSTHSDHRRPRTHNHHDRHLDHQSSSSSTQSWLNSRNNNRKVSSTTRIKKSSNNNNDRRFEQTQDDDNNLMITNVRIKHNTKGTNQFDPHEIDKSLEKQHQAINQHQQYLTSKNYLANNQSETNYQPQTDDMAPQATPTLLLRNSKPRLLGVQNSQTNNNNSHHHHHHHHRNLKQSNTKHWLVLGLFIIGLIICVTSLACLLLLPTFVSQQISRKLVLKNGSMLLERWSKPNVPMFFKVWLYNVKNAQELISRRGIKPAVEEIGPFVFNLKRQKDVISIAGENLYYTERKIYKFNRELSCCAINTTVTIPNIPLVAVVDRALSYNLPLVGRFIPRLINRAIQSLREPMFVRKQVGEILFDGYDVELLKMVSRIGSLVGLPQQSQRFALLKGRNDTWRPEQDGIWAINTGQRDRQLFGRVSSWNSYRKLPFWPSPQCNVINGSDGTLFPPPIQRSQPLYIFNQELCRTVNLVFDRPSDIRSIQAYRFKLNPMNFAHTVSSPITKASSLFTQALQQHQTLQQQQQQQQQALTKPQAASRVGEPLGTPQKLVLVHPLRSQQQMGKKHSAAVRPVEMLKTSSSEQNKQTLAALPASTLTTNDNNNNNNNNKQQVSNLLASEQERLVQEAQRIADERLKQRETPMNPQTCFCDRKTTHLNGVNVCEFDGLIDLSKCSKQAQVIFGSMPHFFNSDPRLLHQVDGMQPNATRHTTYLDIEPNTGLVLGGKRRVQLNLIVKRNNEIDGFENINDMLVPIVWFEESAQIPEEAAQKFRSLYTDRIRLINWTLMSVFLASLVLLAIDLRLMISTRSWRQFKFASVLAATSSSTTAGNNANGSNGKRQLGRFRSALATNRTTNRAIKHGANSGADSQASSAESDEDNNNDRNYDDDYDDNELDGVETETSSAGTSKQNYTDYSDSYLNVMPTRTTATTTLDEAQTATTTNN